MGAVCGEMFGMAMDLSHDKFVGNAFRVDKYGQIESLREDQDRVGDIETFWLKALIAAYRDRGKKCLDIESYQRKRGRYRWDISKYECALCGNDEFIAKEGNAYSLLTEPCEYSL